MGNLFQSLFYAIDENTSKLRNDSNSTLFYFAIFKLFYLSGLTIRSRVECILIVHVFFINEDVLVLTVVMCSRGVCVALEFR